MNKTEKYSLLIKQIRALIESESEYKNDYLAKIIRSVEKEAKSGINTEELLRMAEQLRNLVK